jgi:hydrogenase nickel incorporation protein HypA/HybF
VHELSIAMNIVDIAREEAERKGEVQVKAVHLKVGKLSGVMPEALLTCYEIAAEGTPLKGSRLVIESIPVVVMCPGCQAKRELDSIQDFTCPKCGSPTPQVLQGRELEVTALEIAG